MGQYHKIVNLDKHEFLNPHQLGSGLKAWEQIAGGPGTPAALFILLTASNGRGGGDFNTGRHSYNAAAPGDEWDWHDEETEESSRIEQWIGRWAGDRIAVIGDYAEAGDLDRSIYYQKLVKHPSTTPYINDHPETIYERCVSGPPEACNAQDGAHHRWSECPSKTSADDCGCTHEHIDREWFINNGQPLFMNITPFIRPILEREMGVKFVPPDYAKNQPDGGWSSWLERTPWNWETNEPAPEETEART